MKTTIYPTEVWKQSACGHAETCFRHMVTWTICLRQNAPLNAPVLAKKRDETVGWAFIRYFDQIASSFFPFARLWTMALQRVAAGATANVEDKMKRIVDVNRMGRFFAAKTEDIRKAQGVFFTHRY